MTNSTPMRQLSLNVRFVTPAFLGNAEQNAQWRTPPFKALLRQWWRVVYAAEHNFKADLTEMRYEEGMLFGHAWLDSDTSNGKKVSARKSSVRLRLASVDKEIAWGLGTQSGVAPLANNLDTSYAWFGLIKRGSGLSDRGAIKASPQEDERVLNLAFPETHERQIQKTLQLMDAFALLGSRSRGGWGAFRITPINDLSLPELHEFSRPLEQCLQQDWVMSLAHDESNSLCLWESTNTFLRWDEAMKFIAGRRKEVRTSLKTASRDLRTALGFAAGSGRMPSPLRWKVMANEPGKLMVKVFALPHSIPTDSGKTLSQNDLLNAWNRVISGLDSSPTLQRAK